MTPTENQPKSALAAQTKAAILQTAITLFAEKTYDGTSVNDIASGAGVSKPTIYYYFGNKEGILTAMIQQFIAEYKLLLRHSVPSDSLQKKLQEHYADFGFRNVELIRIILVESLKPNRQLSALFELTETVVDAGNPTDAERPERLVAEFFTGLMPALNYLCFQTQWCQHFAMEKSTLDALFLHHIAQTHGAYHQQKNEQNA